MLPEHCPSSRGKSATGERGARAPSPGAAGVGCLTLTERAGCSGPFGRPRHADSLGYRVGRSGSCLPLNRNRSDHLLAAPERRPKRPRGRASTLGHGRRGQYTTWSTLVAWPSLYTARLHRQALAVVLCRAIQPVQSVFPRCRYHQGAARDRIAHITQRLLRDAGGS